MLKRNFFIRATQRFAHYNFDWQHDTYGYYLPDDIVQPLVDTFDSYVQDVYQSYLGKSILGHAPDIRVHRIKITDAHIPRLLSFELIREAGYEQPEFIADEIFDVLDDFESWVIRPARVGRGGGTCYPPNSYPGYANMRSVIELNSDETVNDPIYMAHEIGHAIAMNNNFELGGGEETHPGHLHEIQSFFMQHMMYDFLKRQSDQDIAEAAQKHFSGEVIQLMLMWPFAKAALMAREASENGARDHLLKTIFSESVEAQFGPGWSAFHHSDFLINIMREDFERDNNAIEKIHTYGIHVALGYGFYKIFKEMDREQQKHAWDTLMMKNGPADILDCLEAFQITDRSSYQVFAQETLDAILKSFQGDSSLTPSSKSVNYTIL